MLRPPPRRSWTTSAPTTRLWPCWRAWASRSCKSPNRQSRFGEGDSPPRAGAARQPRVAPTLAGRAVFFPRRMSSGKTDGRPSRRDLEKTLILNIFALFHGLEMFPGRSVNCATLMDRLSFPVRPVKKLLHRHGLRILATLAHRQETGTTEICPDASTTFRSFWAESEKGAF